MEKLEPVIKQIFWILFGLILIFMLLGWWSASSDLSAQIDKRKSEVKQAFTDASQNVESVPNSKWSDGAQKKNSAHEQDYKKSAEQLWKEQLEARVFPARIRKELNDLRFGSEIKKRALRERFAQLYPSYFRAQLEVIDPFENGEGLVDISNLQITQEDYTRWSTQRPTSKEIWNAQEDIWLLRSILDSIAAVNEGAERIDKAPLRSLSLLMLRGGDRDTKPGATAGGGGLGSGGFGGEEDGGSDGTSVGGFGGGGGLGGGLGGGSSSAWQQFQGDLAGDLLTEEFGADSSSAGGFGGGMGSASFGSGDFGGPEEDDGDSGGGGSGDSDRYVDDDEGLPYRTRAFILHVKMVQTDIPMLLAELTNSSFPVEIVRVDASFGSSGGTSSSMGGGSSDYEEYEGSSGMGSGGMSSGMGSPGMGMGGGGRGGGLGMGMGGSPGGAPGMGSPGMGMGGGGRSGGLGMGMGGSPGMGSGMTSGLGMNGSSSNVSSQKLEQGKRLVAAAMADPSIATVRVAGLMTMYRSEAENDAEAETEEAAQSEASESGGVDMTKAATEKVDADGADEEPKDESANDNSVGTGGETPDTTGDNATDGGDARSTAPAAGAGASGTQNPPGTTTPENTESGSNPSATGTEDPKQPNAN